MQWNTLKIDEELPLKVLLKDSVEEHAVLARKLVHQNLWLNCKTHEQISLEDFDKWKSVYPEMTPAVADLVWHIPEGILLQVACVDGNDLSWVGWPEGMVRTKDCIVCEFADSFQRIALLKEIASSSHATDHRVRAARQALKEQGYENI